jgi:UDP-N-acetylmuramoyl-tripeptide--D-alanyl-D-alanine ligase
MGLLKWELIIKNEIEFLCELAMPDYGYITNFGKAHLEGFGGVAGVMVKSEMYRHLSLNDKFVFVNLEDAIQIENEEFKIMFVWCK